MNRGLIVPIAKDAKGDLTSINNVRGITLSDVISIIFELYILEILNKKLKLDDRQYGFRQHAVWVFEETSRQLEKNNKKGYAIFLNFSKAFDKESRSKMLVSMIGLLGDLEWLALVSYYEISSVMVYLHKTDGNSESFVTEVGVKQGGPLSPTAFNKHIDAMIVEIGESGELLIINKTKGGCMIYADDTTAITDSPEKMQKKIAIIVEYCQKYDIIINEKKTQWMKLGDPVRETAEGEPLVIPPNENERFVINGSPIEKVGRFKLLGVWIMSNGSKRVHIKKRIQAAYAPVPGLNELGLNDPKMDPKIIGTLISTYIRPRIMYGTETMELINQETQDLITCKAKIIKRAMKLSNNSYNTQIYEMLEISSLEWALKKRKITFLKQLMENKITSDIVIGRQAAMDYIFIQLGIQDQGEMNSNEYKTHVINKCVQEINRINNMENKRELSTHTKVIKNLWQN